MHIVLSSRNRTTVSDIFSRINNRAPPMPLCLGISTVWIADKPAKESRRCRTVTFIAFASISSVRCGLVRVVSCDGYAEELCVVTLVVESVFALCRTSHITITYFCHTCSCGHTVLHSLLHTAPWLGLACVEAEATWGWLSHQTSRGSNNSIIALLLCLTWVSKKHMHLLPDLLLSFSDLFLQSWNWPLKAVRQ